MRAVIEFLKTTLIGGVLIVLPVYLVALLLIKSLGGILSLIAPVTAQIPASVEYRQVAAAAVVLTVCFGAGLVVRTRPGSLARAALERRFLSRIPGYEIVRSLTRRVAGGSEEERFSPALVEVEEALAPAFIIEELPDGSYTVMVPSVPTPAAGALFILPPERVHPVDVPISSMFRLFSQFGSGAGVLLEAMQRGQSAQRPGPGA